jgi:dipeptidyl aminopeptidase/acylaminoacyl peptidase
MLPALRVDAAAPWKRRFRAPLIGSTQLARANPARGLVAGNQQSTTVQLYAWDVPTGALRQLTHRGGATREGWIAPDGRCVYFLDDQHGNELGHLVRVPFEGGRTEDVTPDMPAYTLRGVGLSPAGGLLAFCAVNADGFQLYGVPLGPDGELSAPRLIYRSRKEAWGAALSHGGATAAMISTERAGGMRHYSVLAFDTASGERIGEAWDGPEASVEAVAFSPLAGDERILATTTRSGFIRPLLWDPRTGERTDLAFDSLEGEVIPLDWSFDGERLLLCRMDRAVRQLYTYRLPAAALTRLRHPGGIGGSYFGPGSEIFGLWQDAAHPPQLMALDAGTGEPVRTVLSAGEAPPGHAWESVTFPSSDGREVQGWLGLPEGEGPFPTILEVHGGPHFAAVNAFSPRSQAWLDHGFAFFTINYRGSTTFGRAFKEQIWGRVGHWELEDMAAARTYLVEGGIARPDAVFLQGASYGGFLTLLGLGKQPELWAGGLALMAIADWSANYAEASDALKAAFAAWFCGTPEEKPDEYTASSPITYAEHVAASVLILQGRNDTRTTARQMERYEAKMRSLGKSIEVEWFDAGHGTPDVEQNIRFQERMLRFAYRTLGA